MLRAEDARQIYRLRWEVELFFKRAKSGSGMNELRSRKKHIVLTLLYAALIRTTLAMRAKAKLLDRFAPKKRPRINPHQWMKWWNRRLIDVLRERLHTPAVVSFADVIAMLTDPNTGRCPPRFSFVEGQR